MLNIPIALLKKCSTYEYLSDHYAPVSIKHKGIHVRHNDSYLDENKRLFNKTWTLT